jgi:hypothetical protein
MNQKLAQPKNKFSNLTLNSKFENIKNPLFGVDAISKKNPAKISVQILIFPAFTQK